MSRRDRRLRRPARGGGHVPEGQEKLAGGAARDERNHRIPVEKKHRAPEGRWNRRREAFRRPSWAESRVGAGSGGFASLHHRLISQTPPASKVQATASCKGSGSQLAAQAAIKGKRDECGHPTGTGRIPPQGQCLAKSLWRSGPRHRFVFRPSPRVGSECRARSLGVQRRSDRSCGRQRKKNRRKQCGPTHNKRCCFGKSHA